MSLRITCGVAVLTAVLIGPPVLAGQLQLPSPTPAERKILAALDSPTQMEFIDTPLSDVIEYLKDLHSIEIQFSRAAMDDQGIGTDTPITRSLQGVTLRSALRLLLAELDMTCLVRDEVLLITTLDDAQNPMNMKTRIYPVDGLVDESATDSGAEALADVVSRTVLQETWKTIALAPPAARPGMRPPPVVQGGPASVAALKLQSGPVLVVRQTEAGHDEVLRFLEGLREAQEASGEESAAAPLEKRPAASGQPAVDDPFGGADGT